jgi:hypothetical protein
MIAPLILFSLLPVISSSSVELIKEAFLTIVVLITRTVVLGVVRLAIIVTFASTVGYVALVALLLLSYVVTFIIGITTSMVELTATVLLLSEDVLAVALLNKSVL